MAAALLPATLLPTSALAAPSRSSTESRAQAPAWVITPTDTGCRVDLELVARSGAVTPVTLSSDGQVTSLTFVKENLPARAFLPIRIDAKRFSNLVLRGDNGAGELILSEETEAALRRGGTLGVAWLTEEPLTVSLSGSEQGLVDLKVCGAQTAIRRRDRIASETAARERAEAAARANALNDAQLAAVRAQAAAAEAQRRQVEESAARQRRMEAEAQDRAYAEARARTYQEERRRAYEAARREEEEERWAPPVYPPRRAYYPPPRYSYEPY